VGSPSFTLFGLRNELTYCRLGLTVPRKVGGAVRRNRVKRLLREVFRHNRTRLEPRMDLVVNARPAIADRSLGELEQEFLRSFSTLARRKRS